MGVKKPRASAACEEPSKSCGTDPAAHPPAPNLHGGSLPWWWQDQTLPHLPKTSLPMTPTAQQPCTCHGKEAGSVGARREGRMRPRGFAILIFPAGLPACTARASPK